MQADQFAQQLRRNGYRLTRPRQVVFRIMTDSGSALTPAEIYQKGAEHFRIGLVTIYRTLALLEQLNIVRQVHLHGGEHAYVLTKPGHYHTLICERCGRSVEVAGLAEMPRLIEEVERRTGFKVAAHRLELYGLCPKCQHIETQNARGQRTKGRNVSMPGRAPS